MQSQISFFEYLRLSVLQAQVLIRLLGDIIDCDEQMNLKTVLEDKIGVINNAKKAVH